MNYNGKIYGKIGRKYFDTGRTSIEFDAMEKELADLKVFKEFVLNGVDAKSAMKIIEKKGSDNIKFIDKKDQP
jgi:hypothetical protein